MKSGCLWRNHLAINGSSMFGAIMWLSMADREEQSKTIIYVCPATYVYFIQQEGVLDVNLT